MTRHFCIVLRSKPDRIAHAKAQFDREKVPVEFVYAAEGVEHGIAPLYPMHYEQGPDKPYYITAGMLSLTVVNYYIAHMAGLMGLEDWIVYEDDVILPENFLSRLEEIRPQRPPKTRAIWLESCCVDSRNRWQAPHAKDLWRVDPCPLCTAAVWYFDDAWKPIIEKCGRFDTPWDILIENRFAQDLGACAVLPKLCKQATFEGEMASTVSFTGHVPFRGELDNA